MKKIITISSSREFLGNKIPLYKRRSRTSIALLIGLRLKRLWRNKSYQPRKQLKSSNPSAVKLCRIFLSKRSQIIKEPLATTPTNKDDDEEEKKRGLLSLLSSCHEYLYSLDPTSPYFYKIRIKERLNQSGELSLDQVSGYGNGLLVERGFKDASGEFIVLDSGYLVCTETPYHLPLLGITE